MNKYKNIPLLSKAFDLTNNKINEYLQHIQNNQIIDIHNISSNEIVLHHIIPRSWYKQNHLLVDNSKLNTVYLTHKDHCIVHILLAQYYIERNNKSEIMMLLGMCNAVNRMLKKNSSTYPLINQLSKSEIDFLSNNYQKIMITYREKWSNLIRITNGQENKLIHKDDTIPNGWWHGRSIAGKQIYITNGIITKHINKNSPIPDGWRIGTNITPCKNTIWINDGKHNKRILKSDDIPKGYKKGQIVVRRNISSNFILSSKNKKLISNGNESKYIEKDEPLPIGWHYGVKDTRKGKHPHNLNKIWITNGIENKYIDKTLSIPDGWHLGLTQKKTSIRPKKKWITNGIITLQVDYNIDMPIGFYNGRSDLHK